VAWDRFHFAMAMLVMFFFLLPFATPSLMVWIRNMEVGWYKSFGSDHRIDYVAPFVIFVEGLANGTAVTKTTWKRYMCFFFFFPFSLATTTMTKKKSRSMAHFRSLFFVLDTQH
jgi:hypothetical protein